MYNEAGEFFKFDECRTPALTELFRTISSFVWLERLANDSQKLETVEDTKLAMLQKISSHIFQR